MIKQETALDVTSIMDSVYNKFRNWKLLENNSQVTNTTTSEHSPTNLKSDNFLNSDITQTGLNVASSFMSPDYSDTNTYHNQLADTRDQVFDAIQKMGPIGAIVGTANKAMASAGLMSEGTGPMMEDGEINWTNVGNTLAAFSPGTGLIAKKTDSYDPNLELSSGYSNILDSQKDLIGDSKILFGQKKMNNAIQKQKQIEDAAYETSEKNKLLLAKKPDVTFLKNSNLKNSLPNLTIGKEGIKIEKQIENENKKPEFVNPEDLPKNDVNKTLKLKSIGINIVTPPKFLKDGGNIIPSGALHSRKHNMNTTLKITKKGVPVVDKDGNQQAEIEKEEWTIHKDFTDVLEQALSDSKDLKGKALTELYVTIGKKVCYELLENTEDNADLMDKINK